jgi:hypothetical protein
MGVILKKKTGWRPEAFNGVIERWSDGVLEVMGGDITPILHRDSKNTSRRQPLLYEVDYVKLLPITPLLRVERGVRFGADFLFQSAGVVR